MPKRLFVLLLALLLVPIAAAAAPPEPVGYLALTFDDGPSGAATEQFLSELEARGAACTFFLCGYRMEQFPTDLTAYATHGHELAVHGWSHDYLKGRSPEQLAQELGSTANMIEEQSGIRPHWFRPPGGIYDERTLTAAAQQELSVALWSIDPEDWNHRTPDQVVRHILAHAADGAVILMHDIFSNSRTAALELVEQLTQQGYRLVTLSELAERKGCSAIPGSVYSCFG